MNDLDHDEGSLIAEALSGFLAGSPRWTAPVREIRRQASDYRSSFALEEITVGFADGSMLAVIFKDLGWRSLTDAGRRAKPAALYDPLREIDVYRRVLAGRRLGPPFLGAVVDPPQERYWLFVEKGPGVELYQHGDIEAWCCAARWLGRFHHDRGALDAAQRPDMALRLLRRDAAFYRTWIARAVEHVSRQRGTEAAAPLARIAGRYEEVVEFLASLPETFIHGEFYASNVLVEPCGDRPSVCPVDWELAGFGPGAIDLAALVTGNWSEPQRAALIDAYRSALPAEDSLAANAGGLSRAVDCARLHQAVQWLGWSPDWTPPAAHAHDWLREAVEMAARLSLL